MKRSSFLVALALACLCLCGVGCRQSLFRSPIPKPAAVEEPALPPIEAVYPGNAPDDLSWTPSYQTANPLKPAEEESAPSLFATLTSGGRSAEPAASERPQRTVEERAAWAAARTGLDQAELAELLQQIEDVGAIDPELRRELMANLRDVLRQGETDPLLWSQLRGTVMAAISYRKQAAERQAKLTANAPAAEETPVDAQLASHEAEKPPVEAADGETSANEGEMVAVSDAGVTGTAHTTAATDFAQNEQHPANAPAHAADSQALAQQIAAALHASRAGFDSAGFGGHGPPHETALPGFALDLPYGPLAARRSAPLLSAPYVAMPPALQRAAPSTAEPDAPTVKQPTSSAADWRAELHDAIAALEAQTAQPPQTADEVNRHAALRLLYLLAGRRDDAATPIRGVAPELQDFWANQVYGLSVYRDAGAIEDPTRRAAVAAEHFRYAAERLGEAAQLEVRNLVFCKSAQGYGLYEPFERDDFQPEQQVVLYTEVENFRTTPSAQGHFLSLSGSFQILDEHGRVEASGELGPYEEHCRARRRDLYYSNLIRFPRSLDPGRYTLQVTVEDQVSRKIGANSIAFTIGGDRRTGDVQLYRQP